MAYEFIKLSFRDDTAVLEMNRKHEMNALSYGMLKEIDHAFTHSLGRDSQVRLVVLTGGDECFSAGMDIKEFSGCSNEEVKRYFNTYMDVYTRLMEYEKILIAAVSGIAFGGGFNLALMGDFIIASESAIFGHPEIKYGFNPMLTPLVSRIGMAKSKEMAFRGEPVGAREALDMGLVNSIVSPEGFREEVNTWADEFSRRPSDVVRALKRAFDVVTRLDARAAIEYEMEMTAILINSRPDIREKLKGFSGRSKRSGGDHTD
ncbi:MAG: enoyl-CoA hydratase/isomerase family protein [Thermodesulfobacteriota bacterium]|nr:enoyl-CoA hydratase/isomerase family protein [Thermodesulfobacteriota bacterium]